MFILNSANATWETPGRTTA